MNLTLNTPEKIRQVWPLLTPADIATLAGEGTIESVVQATFTPSVLGNRYSGIAQTRRVWVCGDHRPENIVGEVEPWRTVNDLNPETLYEVAGVLVSSEPLIQLALLEQNGGAMPEILTPQ